MDKNWSIREIQDIVVEKEEWEKKNLYATDSEKCPRGLYLSLIGEKATYPIDPQALRRMEVGTMIERNQVEKLKSLGILIEAQRRIYDEEGNVSGRHDGIIISPIHCSEEAKACINRKKEIYISLKALEGLFWESLSKYESGEYDRDTYNKSMLHITNSKTDYYDEDKLLNQRLLVPNPENQLIVLEIKSIVEMGFKYRKSDGVPMDSHRKQAMFYLWKLRETYPDMKARVLYVDTSYQNLLEFDVELDQLLLGDMKRFWKSINEAVASKNPPPEAPSIVKDTKTGKWKVNFMAEWCRYHDKCTGDPEWKIKAIKKVAELNEELKSCKKKK